MKIGSIRPWRRHWMSDVNDEMRRHNHSIAKLGETFAQRQKEEIKMAKTYEIDQNTVHDLFGRLDEVVTMVQDIVEKLDLALNPEYPVSKPNLPGAGDYLTVGHVRTQTKMHKDANETSPAGEVCNEEKKEE